MTELDDVLRAVAPAAVVEALCEKRDYSLLRPFDLEAAKRGEVICFDGDPTKVSYIAGPDKRGNIICDVDGYFNEYFETALRMAPLCWVEGRPVYRGDVLYYRDSTAFGERTVNHVTPRGNIVFSETPDVEIASSILTWSPPKVKREVKLLAYLDADQLFWLRETATPKWPAVRVPSEDKTVDVEEPAEVAK